MEDIDKYINFIDNVIDDLENQKKSIDKEVEIYTLMIFDNPQNFEAYISRGNIYLNNKLEEKAINDFTKALKYSNNLNIYLYRSEAFRRIGNYKKAIEDCEVILKSKPGHYLAYFKRGNIYFEEGKYKKAVEDYSNAIKYNPENKILYKNRALAYKKLNMETEYKNNLKLYMKLTKDK